MSENIENNSQISLNSDIFLRSLIKELAGSLEDIIGIDEASGYISLVGQALGREINTDYCKALSVENIERNQLSDVLIDLKRRINGKFFLIEENEDKIIVGNHRCPFGNKVIGHTSMCMMTSNVFGYISSESSGYSKVELQETIANGDKGCRIVIYLKPNKEANAALGREYIK